MAGFLDRAAGVLECVLDCVAGVLECVLDCVAGVLECVLDCVAGVLDCVDIIVDTGGAGVYLIICSCSQFVYTRSACTRSMTVVMVFGSCPLIRSWII